ncbi:hypothetical protein [Stenotrophomonas sp.]|uniref:DUF6984 family protein n=1 Tax=Stenotrophomonas sp. TaxID=69392 RepID=UPI0029C07A49|nr:hypothetical protein [Stenotrophomonas sp.]
MLHTNTRILQGMPSHDIASPLRTLHAHERLLIEAVAAVLPADPAAQLRADAGVVMAVDESTLLVGFVLAGHARPTPPGDHPYPVDIEVPDADGEALSIILFADEDGRLLQLEIIRWDDEAVRAPRWDEATYAV